MILFHKVNGKVGKHWYQSYETENSANQRLNDTKLPFCWLIDIMSPFLYICTFFAVSTVFFLISKVLSGHLADLSLQTGNIADILLAKFQVNKNTQPLKQTSVYNIKYTNVYIVLLTAKFRFFISWGACFSSLVVTFLDLEK